MGLRLVGVVAAAFVASTLPTVAAHAAASSRAVAQPTFGVEGNYQPLVGDFDGDHRDDIFWYAPGEAADSVWFGGADRQFTVRSEQVLGSYRPIVLDVNGDGRSDIVWYRPGSRHGYIWRGQADRTFLAPPFGTPIGDYEPVAGDFNGDGHDDIIWYAPGFAHSYQWRGDGHGSFSTREIHINGFFRLTVGDFNGDGRDDLFAATTKPGEPSYVGTAYPDGSYAFGAVTGVPPNTNANTIANTTAFALDANRDGSDDLFFYGPGHVPDSIWYGGSTGIPRSRVATEIDGADYVPFAGDFDGDGHDDAFWYAPSTSPDAIWFDVAHDTAPRGRTPLVRWKVPLFASHLVAATVDATTAYAVLSNHQLQAYDRGNGLPKWQRSITCTEPTLHRQLEILKATCPSPVSTYVYDAATGAPRYHYDAWECLGDNSYLDALVLSGHLTVIAARTGAVLWQSPVTSKTSCAISGDRLMVGSPNGAVGAAEYSISTHQQVFAYPQGTVYRFAPGGYVAMCAGNQSQIIGLRPNGYLWWPSLYSCDGTEVPQDFGRSIVDRFVDIDIVAGKVLGVVTFPQPASFSGHASSSHEVYYYAVNPPASGSCIRDHAALAFAGPYGVSPTLPAAIEAGFDFSNRAIAVLRPAAGGCHSAHLLAFDQDGTFRWDLIEQLDPHAPVGNDMATNGGDESSALLGINPIDRNLSLIDLP